MIKNTIKPVTSWSILQSKINVYYKKYIFISEDLCDCKAEFSTNK